jgi:inorganic pyrophosphatase/exopolyphosphatase
MSLPSSALRQFLKQSSSLADVDQPLQRVVVLGNEAGDLDSVAASIALSFLLATSTDATTPPVFSGICASRSGVFPVLNFQREDISLRKDVLYVLAEAGIDVSYVVFIDDVPLQPLADKNLLQLLLVDHNVLCPSQVFAASHVIGCIDHHADAQPQPSPQRCIRTVGSCCSIIADLFSQHPQLGCVAFLLATAITIDTKDLKSPVTTDADRSAMRCLRAHLDSFDDARAGEICRMLQQLRLDVSGLTVAQLFLKDLKQFSLPCGVTITFSSLSAPISALKTLDNSWTGATLDLILARGWHLLVALASVDPASGLRSLVIFARDDAAAALVHHPLPALHSAQPPIIRRPSACSSHALALFQVRSAIETTNEIKMEIPGVTLPATSGLRWAIRILLLGDAAVSRKLLSPVRARFSSLVVCDECRVQRLMRSPTRAALPVFLADAALNLRILVYMSLGIHSRLAGAGTTPSALHCACLGRGVNVPHRSRQCCSRFTAC